jgi:PAS domain S-box-containing protein
MVIWWGAELILIFNDSWRPILGEKRGRALGRPGREIWPEVWDVIGPMFESVMTTGQATWSDDGLLLINRYGYTEEAYFTWSYSPIRDESGNIGGVYTAVTETTARVIAERRMQTLRDLAACGAQAKEITEACRVTAEALAANTRDIPFALLYLLDDDKQARLVGAVGVELGKEVSPLVVDLRDEAAGATVWPLDKVARTGKAEAVKGLGEKFGYLPDGPWRERPREAVVAPVMLPGRAAPSLLLALAVSPRLEFDDEYHNFFNLVVRQVEAVIANVVAYEQERKRAEALAELDRAKTAFFSNISHELRTPLTLMLGPIEDALAEDELGPHIRERLEVARRNSLRLLKLVNTLLDFSRIEAGRIQAVYEPVDLAALTADLASVFRSAIERAGMKLIIDCPPLVEAVYIDREMWEKIVLNLVSNAFKFTFDGEIEVSLKSEGKSVELTVRDTGTGIPLGELPHVFERFYRVKGASGRSYEGSGIGLALVQELVKLHGGTVRAESEPGHGSRFIVSIPQGHAHLPPDRIGAARSLASTGFRGEAYVEEALLWLPSEVKGQRDEETERWIDREMETMGAMDAATAVHPSRRPSVPPSRILIADDNADMRDYVRRLLAANHEVEAVADGEAALEAARRRQPDLILTDVMMPKLDGVGLLRELRADEELKTIPVILLSARAGEESRVEGMEAGADDYLIKPFSARELMARVEAHLKLQRVRRRSQEALRASERKFSVAFEQSPLALTITSLDDERLMDVNESFVRLLGYTRDEATGRTSEELNIWVDPNQRAEWLRRLRAGERISGFEYRYRMKSGEERVAVLGSSLIEIDSRLYILSSIADITERMRMEELLRESRERLRFALESAQVGDWDLDLTTGKAERSFLHDKCFGATGPFAEWSYENFLSFVHPDDLAEVERKFGKAIAEQTGWHFECRVIWRDGSIHWIEAHGRVYHTIGGKPARMLGVVADITERKHAEDLLRQNASQLALITDTAPVFIAHCDAEKRFKFVNKAYAERFGLTPEDCVGKRIPEVVGVEAYESFRQYVEVVLRGEPVEFEVEIPYAGIGKHFMHCSYAPEFGESGEVVGLVAVITDVSERKRSEIFLDAQKQSLEMVVSGAPLAEVLTYLTRVIERQADGQVVASIMLLDEQGCLRNGTAPSLPEDYNRAVDGLKVDPDLGTCSAAAARNEVVITPDIGADPNWRTLKHLPLGLGFHAAWSNPITSRDGRVLGTFGTYFRERRKPSAIERREVEILSRTAALAIERKQADEEIARLLSEEQAAREIAEQATRAKDEFLAVVSHELRSPLNAILGWIRLLRSQRSDDPQIARVTETVESSGKAQLRLIEDLLDTARIISGKMKLEPQPVELVDVISSTLDAVRPAADGKGIVIVPDLDPEVGRITGDSDRIQQIVWNLVSNAIKFTPEGGWVWVELRRGGPGVQIIVRDSGQGISSDLLPYVFDRFRQADSSVSRRFGGLGLGLALVKNLVELHGGSVTVESPGEGQGATFTVNLPAQAVKGDVEAVSRAKGKTVVARPALSGLQPVSLSGVHALVVEDEADARELITLTLEQHGAMVTGVDSAAAALDALESQLEDGAARAPFDVLISDIGMPDADGYELIRRVRAHADKRVSDIHAIALTAYSRTEDRLQALQAGFHMHVPKPVDEAELTTVIAALTGRAPGQA